MLTLPRILGDGCVLQANTVVPIWGWSEPSEHICVQIDKTIVKTQADGQGSWQAALPPTKCGGPFDCIISAESGDSIRQHCYIGEVFLCSGQSNMELPMEALRFDYPKTYASADDHLLRQYKVNTEIDFHERHRDHASGEWKSCNADSIGEFSAIAYWFGHSIRKLCGAPVGLINVSLGGSPIESWMDSASLERFPEELERLRPHLEKGAPDRLSRQSLEEIERWHKELDGKQGAVANDWEEIQLPDTFKGTGLEGFVGKVELRKTIYLTSSQVCQNSLLRLGTWSDEDETYVNEHFVGAKGNQYESRDYAVGPGILKEGENRIKVILTCDYGSGRVTPNKSMILKLEDEQIDLSGIWEYRILSRAERRCPVEDFIRWKPTVLFNGMLAPCIPYAVHAVLWYQGESNTGNNARSYQAMLESMIKLWRKEWQRDDLPFLIVQLPNFGIDCIEDGGWPLVREAQYSVSAELENVATVVTLDAGEWNDLHPRNKRIIADRLFDAAQALLFGKHKTHPVLGAWKINNTTGELSVRFLQEEYGKNHCETTELSPLATLDGDCPGEFTWFWRDGGTVEQAETWIIDNEIHAKLPQRTPTSLRYAWSNNPSIGLLCDDRGVPVSPFRIEITSSSSNPVE